MAKQKDWRKSDRYVSFAGIAPTPTKVVETRPLTTPKMMQAQKDLPAVARPNVPDTDEQASPAAMESALGWVADKLDNVVPDDMGGIARGQSGWLGLIPGYRQTGGAVADLALSGGEAAMNAMFWGSEQMNHLGAALMSWMPGGIQTLDWDQSHDVSFGQVGQANAGIMAARRNAGDPLGALLAIAGTGTIFPIASVLFDSEQPVVANADALAKDNTLLLDKNFQQEAFKDSTAGSLGSGISDAIWTVAADPTIIGGKYISVLRLGTKAGRMGGYANQSLSTAKRVLEFGQRVDKNVAFRATGGAQGRATAEGENIADLISGRNIENNIFIKNSNNPRLLTELAHAVDPDDFATGAALVKAGAGDASGWATLRSRRLDLYDRLAIGMGVDPMERLAGMTALTADQSAYGKQLVDQALKAVDEESAAAGRLITRGGGRSLNATKAANAWRRGATVTKEDPLLGKGGWAVTTVELVAGSRPVRILRYLGQDAPSGIVHLKGGDGNTSLREVQAFLRKSRISGDTATRLYSDFVAATTPEARRAALIAMEQADVAATAARHGLSPKVAQQIYDDYAAKRHRHLTSLRNRQEAYAVDDSGGLVTTPGMFSELDESFPMLNQAVFHKVVRQNAKWLSGMEDVTNVLDTINKYWKLSVLIRLGYTERNLTEGGMRSLAALGLAAMNPRALTRLPANMYYYSGTRAMQRTLSHQEKALNLAHQNLMDARAVLTQTRKDARVEKMLAQRTRATALNTPIKKLQDRLAKNGSLSKSEQAELDRLLAKRQKHLDEADYLKVNYVDPAAPELARLGRNEATLLQSIDDLSAEILDTAARLRAKNAKRVKTGRSSNVMDDGTAMPGSFEGVDGDLAALLSSADRTAHMTFDAGFESRRAAIEASENWVALDPATMNPARIRDFWDEYAIRLNQRYRADQIVRMWLASDEEVTGVFGGNVVDRAKSFLMSPAGKQYRDSMSIDGRKLSRADGAPREAAVEEYLTELWHRYNREIPKDTGLRAMLAQDSVTPAEVAAAFGKNTPPPIPVRSLPAETMDSLATKARRGVDSFTALMMKGLGSFPETVLLRHPFYDAVYRAEQKRLWRLASEQGQDMTSATVKTRINRSAHNEALKATKTTMYTIERVSNLGTMLRWVAPFFPAFENSIRTWGRLVIEKPQILGIGNLLWNVPNKMGLVYDENGQPVAHSNMFKDEKTFIVMPQAFNDFLVKNAPDFLNPAGPIAWRQSGMNVIFQGGDWWWPGVGPMAATPTALLLRGKPDTVDVLRANLSDTMFNSVIPQGNPNISMKDLWLSTAAKRVDQMFTGTSENGAYLTLMNTVVEDIYIQAQIEGRAVTEADMQRAQDTVEKFWKWSIRAAALDFTPSRYYSPYEMHRAYWRQLLDDQSLSYEEKLRTFKEKYPDMMAVTRSGTESVYGVQPNLSTWRKITDNPGLVERLNGIDPELVGMFANMGSFDDPFSYSVYGEYKNMTIGKDGKPVKDQLTPGQLLKNNEVTDGWSAFNEIEAALEDQAFRAGFSSLQVKGAERWKELLDEGEALVGARYPLWAIEHETYERKWPKFIAGARIMVQNPQAVQEDSTIRTLDMYLQMRDWIANKKESTDNDDARRALTALGLQKAAELRQMDIGFADLYDRYLVYDDFGRL